ncbi:hypothetical protein PINS_up024046 [Pythium insidiosum]|nr:hypothetical protein PINS_up024046 [Pythium insidiosum]
MDGLTDADTLLLYVWTNRAAGAHFNEAIFREFTVTASTPVEVLLLSKYDVFHRLSRAARETLRAAARCPVEGVVYLDRFHKTVKWDAYKQQVLREHLDSTRLSKLLPGVAAADSTTRKNSKEKRKDSPPTTLDKAPSTETTTVAPTTSPTTSEPIADATPPPDKLPQLVGANDFLLLDPERLAMAKREWTPLPPHTNTVHSTDTDVADGTRYNRAPRHVLQRGRTAERRETATAREGAQNRATARSRCAERG